MAPQGTVRDSKCQQTCVNTFAKCQQTVRFVNSFPKTVDGTAVNTSTAVNRRVVTQKSLHCNAFFSLSTLQQFVSYIIKIGIIGCKDYA